MPSVPSITSFMTLKRIAPSKNKSQHYLYVYILNTSSWFLSFYTLNTKRQHIITDKGSNRASQVLIVLKGLFHFSQDGHTWIWILTIIKQTKMARRTTSCNEYQTQWQTGSTACIMKHWLFPSATFATVLRGNLKNSFTWQKRWMLFYI